MLVEMNENEYRVLKKVLKSINEDTESSPRLELARDSKTRIENGTQKQKSLGNEYWDALHDEPFKDRLLGKTQYAKLNRIAFKLKEIAKRNKAIKHVSVHSSTDYPSLFVYINDKKYMAGIDFDDSDIKRGLVKFEVLDMNHKYSHHEDRHPLFSTDNADELLDFFVDLANEE